MTTPTQEPALKRTRVLGFDVARCLAILSMVFVNFDVILSMGRDKPELLRTLGNAFQGRASATFVTLAGVGLILLGERGTLMKRALFLFIVGYAWQVYWDGDILHYYAFYVFAGALCLGLKARWLWLLSAASVAVFVVCVKGVSMGDFELEPVVDYGAGWKWMTLEYTEFWTVKGQARNLFFNGWHPLFPWLAFLFCGMALGKWGVEAAMKRRVALVASAAVFFLARSLSEAWTQTEGAEGEGWGGWSQWYLQPEAFWALDSIPPGPLYVLSAGASAVFVIALCLELTSPSTRRRWWLGCLSVLGLGVWIAFGESESSGLQGVSDAAFFALISAVGALLIDTCSGALSRCGQLAFTLYLAHVLFLYVFLQPVMEHLIDERVLSRRSVLLVSATGTLVFDLFAILFANRWRASYRRGPVEAVMRKLTG